MNRLPATPLIPAEDPYSLPVDFTLSSLVEDQVVNDFLFLCSSGLALGRSLV